MTRAHSGRAEGGFRSARAPGGAVHGPPPTPPHPGAALRPRPHAHAGRERTDDTRGARIKYRRPPQRRGAGRRARHPPPTPPPARKPRGPRPPPPEAGGMVPLPPERGAGARPAPPPQPPAPTGAAENKRARANAPGRRTDRTQRSLVSTGVVWGATPPMDSTTPVTPALLPAQGRQRDGTRQSDPPPYSPPPGRTNGGYGARPPPPARPPAHERHRPAPRRAAPTGRAGRGDREGPPHPHARAHNTWSADPDSPPSGRAVGGGGAPDPRRPSQQ